MLMVGVQTAPVCALAAAALEFAFHGGGGVLWAGVFGGVNGLLSGPIALAVMPVAEFAFGYTSDIRLMELASTGHPLLSRMMVETPGTFHHSVVVGRWRRRARSPSAPTRFCAASPPYITTSENSASRTIFRRTRPARRISTMPCLPGSPVR